MKTDVITDNRKLAVIFVNPDGTTSYWPTYIQSASLKVFQDILFVLFCFVLLTFWKTTVILCINFVFTMN